MSGWSKILLLAVVWACALKVAAQPSEAAFDAANKLYDEGKFSEAANAYMQIIRQGKAPLSVYFNLGNALFKKGERGKAIAAYRMVEANTPRDPDLRANLDFALRQVQGPTARDGWGVRAIRKLTLNEWAIAASVGLWLTLLFLSLGQLRATARKTWYRYAAGTAVATTCLTACLAIAFHEAFGVQRAIVIAPEAHVRRGPLEESEAVFSVSDGAELRVLDARGDWVQVIAGPGKTGWVRIQQIQTSSHRG